MPDLLRYWYLGSKARRHMVMRRFSEVDAEIPDAGGGTVLDIGSAWGYNVMALGKHGIRAVALDLVVDQFPAGARIARENSLDFVAVGADAARLPFLDSTFRSITMVETLEHVYGEDRAAAMRECHRVLEPGGTLIVSTPNYASLVERFKRAAVRHPRLKRRFPTMCYPAGDVERGDYHPYRYHNPLSERAIARLVESSGFTVRRVKYFLFVLKNTPDVLLPVVTGAERILEKVPLIGRLAATICMVADKSQ